MRTLALGVVALATVGAVAVGELGRVWRRRACIEHSQTTPELLAAGATAAREAVQVARSGYGEIEPYETVAFNLMSAFVLSFAVARTIAFAIRERVRPFDNLRISGRHVHHFVPGILLTCASGIWGVLSDDPRKAPRVAIPLGVGMGLVFDESALLLELEDVYWTREGLLGVQIALATATLLATTALAVKVILRGERKVFGQAAP